MAGLAFPPFRTGFLAYGALIPLFILLQGKTRTAAFKWGYIAGLFFNMATLFWIGNVTVPGLFGAMLILPLYTAFYAFFHAHLLRRLSWNAFVYVPFLWTAIEYLQSLGEMAFPWTHLGYTQSYYLPLIQYAEYLGVYGVSFWVACLNVLLFLAYHSAGWRKKGYLLFVILAFFIVPLGHGLARLYTPLATTHSLKIALIQGNIDPFEKWEFENYHKNFLVYDRLTKISASSEPDLIIWPETATPFFLRHEFKYLDLVAHLIDSLQTPLLTGSVDYDYDIAGERYYNNSAFLIEPHSVHLQRYAKNQLVPFSERVPYRNYFPFRLLKKILYDLNTGIGDYAKGETLQVLEFNTPDDYRSKSGETGSRKRFRVAVPICYESVFPEIVRRFAFQQIDFIAIITNDAWFGKTSAPYQHAQIAVFRAIENRRSIARCANTGVSCFIDAFGRLTNATPIFHEKIAHGTIAIHPNQTFFTKHGNLFAQIVSVIALSVLLIALLPAARFLKTRGDR